LSTSSDSLPETVLVYAGPSVSEREVFDRVPNAVVRPPVRQSDLLSDLHAVNPTHVLLIDGEFQQSFSVWLKEVMYAIVHPGVRGVYGASSMGAIRAAELHGLGMVGFGKVFAAYRDGVTFDDAEVAVAYQRDREGRYRSTVPMVNLRFSKVTPEQWDAAQAIHWSERWPHRLAQAVPGLPEIVDQKHEDALELLETFRSLKPSTDTRPSPQHLNGLFLSQYDRDRRIRVGEREVCLQRVDAAVALESPDRHETFWNAANRTLAMAFAAVLGVDPSPEEIQDEGVRFCQRLSLTEGDALERWIWDNGLNDGQFHALMRENAQVRKLQRALTGLQLTQRKTRSVLDHLRTHGRFAAWAAKAAREGDEREHENGLFLTTEYHTERQWRSFSQDRGIPVDGTFQDFLREYGFYLPTELLVELAGRSPEDRP
jgi:hypothetical protein